MLQNKLMIIQCPFVSARVICEFIEGGGVVFCRKRPDPSRLHFYYLTQLLLEQSPCVHVQVQQVTN